MFLESLIQPLSIFFNKLDINIFNVLVHPLRVAPPPPPASLLGGGASAEGGGDSRAIGHRPRRRGQSLEALGAGDAHLPCGDPAHLCGSALQTVTPEQVFIPASIKYMKHIKPVYSYHDILLYHDITSLTKISGCSSSSLSLVFLR